MNATLTITDNCPDDVWKFWGEQDYATTEFWAEYADLLDLAAIRLLVRHMIAEWAGEDIVMFTLSRQDFVADKTHTQLWNATQDAFDFDDILIEAELTDEYSAFVHAQPDYDL